MFLAKLAINRPVLATVVIMILVVFGLYSMTLLSQEQMPNIDLPFVVVSTIYPGAGPKEVETQVSEKLEEEISSVAGLDKMQSQSMENLSLLILQFEMEVDGAQAALDVKDKVDIVINDLPDEAETPVVQQYNINSAPILNVAINSNRPLEDITRLADTRIKDELSKIDGVSKVEVVGGLEREIHIAVRPDRLKAYGLAINDLVGFIQAENLNFPTGRILGITTDYALRMVGEFDSLEVIRNIRLVTPKGARIRLSDVAEIVDTYQEPDTKATFQGKPAVSLQVMKKDDANTVRVADSVYKVVDELKPWLEQQQMEATIANDKSIYIRDSVRDVSTNIIIGIILTSILLYLFLHDLRSTIIVAVSMPASLVATFSLMYFANFTINIVSMMALGISIGVLVTNSIVVLENINNKLQAGKSPADAAIMGAGEIAVAVIASTMTNIVVFSPIAFMKGIIGKIFMQFGLTVVFATIISLLISFTLTPMMAALLLRKVEHNKEKKRWFHFLGTFAQKWDAFYDNLAEDYRSALRFALNRRWVVVLATIVVFFAAMMLFGQVGVEFFTTGDEGIITIKAKFPPGTALEQTDRSLQKMAKNISDTPELDTLLIEIGGTGKGVNEGSIRVNLVKADFRNRTTNEVMDSFRPLVSAIPGAEINIFAGEERGGMAPGVEIEVTGPDLKEINKISEQIIEILKGVDGMIDIRSSYEAGKPEMVFKPNRDRMSQYGVTSYNIAMSLRTAFEGTEVSYFRELGENYDIRVLLDRQYREELDNFSNMLIRVGSSYIPLTQLGSVTFEQSETLIERKNKQRLVKVNANVSGITTGEAVEKVTPLFNKQINVPSGYNIHFGGEDESRRREFGYIMQALLLAILLTYMVLAAILEDFIHPFTIMLTLPLGLVGVAVALFLGGVSINLMSLMAIVMLVGIVVNNAILILDYAKQLREQGMDIREALIEASATRLRPIIMTNLAIAISVAPQTIAGAGAEYRRALAVVTMGGVLISAVFTLFLIPAIYTAFDRFAIKPKVKVTEEYEQ